MIVYHKPLQPGETLIPQVDVIEETALMLSETRARVEGDCICAILSAHRVALPIAESRGVTADHFDQPDYPLIFHAIDYGRHADLIDVLRYARYLLKHGHRWFEGEIAANWRLMRHSDATLARMAMVEPFEPRNVVRRADALIEACRHERRFGRLVRAAEGYASTIVKWAMVAAPDAVTVDRPAPAITDMLAAERKGAA